MDNLQLIGAFFVGIIAGFMSAVGGGGGLISIPFLLFLGVSPQITLATNKFGGLGGAYGGIIKYIREKKVVWKYAIGLSVTGVLGSLIGSRILITADTDILNRLIGVLLLILVPTLFIRKDFGIIKKEHNKSRHLAGYLVYFFFSIIASFFGAVGPLMIANVVFFFGLPFIEANATEYVSFAVLSTSAVVIYFVNNLVDLQLGIVLFISMLIGGYIGAHTAIKKGDHWVKAFYAIVVIISALKILIG